MSCHRSSSWAERRLSLRTLGSVLSGADTPPYDPRSLPTGIVHLGLGAFHRAHQAVYTEDALRGDPGPWGIVGVSQRSRNVIDQLAAQDGLYSLVERHPDQARVRVVGTIRDLLLATEEPDRLGTLLSAPATRIVSLTVTEKGYRHDPATGRLRVDDPEVAADLAGRPPRTVVGQLARGLRARYAADRAPLTVLSCDNLPNNGKLLRALVTEFCARMRDPASDALAAWVENAVAFPSTVVDRIVPATAEADRAQVAQCLGVVDLGAVVAEPYRQWVIEDRFPAGRPSWEKAGALFTADVTPYQVMKLRLLNGAHSLLAYLGAQAGHRLLAAAAADPMLRGVLDRYFAEIKPIIPDVQGIRLDDYTDRLAARFTNPAIAHRTEQIAMDGSQKLPQRLLDSARDLLARGQPPAMVSLAVAAWIRYLRGVADDGTPLTVDDPLAAQLRAIWAADQTPAKVVDRFLRVSAVFGDDLPRSDIFRDLVVEWLTHLERDNVAGTLRAIHGE